MDLITMELMAAADATTAQTFPVFKLVKYGRNSYQIYTSADPMDMNIRMQYNIHGETHVGIVTVEEFYTNNIEQQLRELIGITAPQRITESDPDDECNWITEWKQRNE